MQPRVDSEIDLCQLAYNRVFSFRAPSRTLDCRFVIQVSSDEKIKKRMLNDGIRAQD